MVQQLRQRLRDTSRRGTAILLALVLLCGLIPAIAPTAQAAGWAQGYLDTLSGWGVMRGDI